MHGTRRTKQGRRSRLGGEVMAGGMHRRQRVGSRSHGRSKGRGVRLGAKMWARVGRLGARSQGQGRVRRVGQRGRWRGRRRDRVRGSTQSIGAVLYRACDGFGLHVNKLLLKYRIHPLRCHDGGGCADSSVSDLLCLCIRHVPAARRVKA